MIVGSGSDPEQFLESLAGLGMEMFEVNDEGDLEPVTDYREHTRKIGSSYGDVVVMSKEAADRMSPGARRNRDERRG